MRDVQVDVTPRGGQEHGGITPVPEPGTLSLVASGFVAGVSPRAETTEGSAMTSGRSMLHRADWVRWRWPESISPTFAAARMFIARSCCR